MQRFGTHGTKQVQLVPVNRRQTVHKIDNDREEKNWLLSLCVNKAGDILFRIDIFKPIRITLDKVAWIIDYSDSEIENEVYLDILENVSVKEKKDVKKLLKESFKN